MQSSTLWKPSLTSLPSVLTTMTIAIAVAVTVVLGVLPTQVLDLAAQASQFVR